jgi:hypothetical protein
MKPIQQKSFWIFVYSQLVGILVVQQAHRFCASGGDEQTSAFNRYWASVNRLDKFLSRPGKMLSSSGGQTLLLPGLALWLIKIFVSLQQDGPADVILFPRLTQSRFVNGQPIS